MKHTEIMNQWCIPEDHSRQANLSTMASRVVSENEQIRSVLDLGCGRLGSVDLFRDLNPEISWVGVDLEQSPEVDQRTREDADYRVFDGISLPFEDDAFDLVYCNQVFEHVTHPRELLAEVHRVLKPGGLFVGSTSQLEPYHSLSVWNFTPHGFRVLIQETGLLLVEIRPGIDALTLLVRTALGRPGFFSRWWRTESPLNRLIGLVGWVTRKSRQEINFAKLIFCGQFCFLIRKP